MLNELQFKDIVFCAFHFGNTAALDGVQHWGVWGLRRASCEICESLSPSHGHRGNRTSVSLKPSAITIRSEPDPIRAWSDQLLMPFKWDLHDHWEKPFRDQTSVVPSKLSFHSNSCWKNWNSLIILTPPPPNHIRDHLEANLESKDRKHFMNRLFTPTWRRST